jgi:hypothetical protein
LDFFVLAVADGAAWAKAQAAKAHEAFWLYPRWVPVFHFDSLRGADGGAMLAANAFVVNAEVFGAFAAVYVYAGVELSCAFGFAIGHCCRPLGYLPQFLISF